MSKYFDKDFFKFTMVFATIVSISLVIIVATRMYQNSLLDDAGETASVINSINISN